MVRERSCSKGRTYAVQPVQPKAAGDDGSMPTIQKPIPPALVDSIRFRFLNEIVPDANCSVYRQKRSASDPPAQRLHRHIYSAAPATAAKGPPKRKILTAPS
ncbi:hypothetical protein KCP77_17615 [Salmonella enterica subsp. enterica]|nr:hypothetical protein KCP77_17615 [Salmonella enterica subsp. enterica]